MFETLSRPAAVTLVIMAILLLSVGNSDHLTWKECLRLLVILLGLLYGGIKWREKLNHISKLQKAEFDYLSIGLALCVIFVMTQFDPATSAIAFGHMQNRLNLFFIVTSVLIVVPSTSFVIFNWRQLGWKYLTYADRIVFFIILGFLAISTVSGLISGASFTNGWGLSIIKVLGAISVWFLVTKSFGHWSNRGSETEGSWTSKFEANRWKIVFWCIVISFGLTIVNGMYRTAKVVNYYFLSQEALEQKDQVKAEAYFRTIRQINESVDLRYVNRRILADLVVIHFDKAEDRKAQELIRSLGEDITYSKKDRSLFIGQIYFRAQKWSRAVEEYKKLLALGDKDSVILDNMGVALTYLGDIRGVLDLVSKYGYIPEVDVRTYEDAVFWAKINLYYKRFKEARSYLEFASSLAPFNAYPQYKIGRVCLDENQLQIAVAHFLKAIELEPGFADSYFRLGICYEKQNMRIDAIRMYKKTITLLPNHLGGLQSLSRMSK
jgi:tetratricopeptide (TPR) repeat protein